jgi:hypothetical protein
LRAGFLAVVRKLADECLLAVEPEQSLPIDARVDCEPYEAVEAAETERGDMSSKSARSAPRAALDFLEGGGVWDRSRWVAAMLEVGGPVVQAGRSWQGLFGGREVCVSGRDGEQ